MEKEEDESSRIWRSSYLNDPFHVSTLTQAEGGGPKGVGLKRWHRFKRDSDPIPIRSSSRNNLVDSTTTTTSTNAADDNTCISSTNPLFTRDSDRCSSKSSSTAATADPLVYSTHMLNSAVIALGTEVQRYQELGKEVPLLLYDSNEGDTPFDGWASEYHLYSNKNVEILKTRLSEAEGRLKEREIKTVELEETKKNMNPPGQNGTEQRRRCQDMEAELDSMFKEKIKAEIEHLLITRSTKELSVLVENQRKLLRGQKGVAMEEMRSLKTLTDLEKNDVMLRQSDTTQGTEGGGNIMNMRRKAVTSAKCFGIQLSLLVLVSALFMSRLTPKSAVVVPT